VPTEEQEATSSSTGGGLGRKSSPVETALMKMVFGIASENSASLEVSSGPVRSELISQIVDALEERVIAELERRGRRHNPGVF